MIHSDGRALALIAFIAVVTVAEIIVLVLLWRETVGGRVDARAARERELKVLERLAPPKPAERRKMGFMPGGGGDEPRAEVRIYYADGGEDAARTVREVAG